jgi:hypothetical protein
MWQAALLSDAADSYFFSQDYVVFHKQLSDLYHNQVDWFWGDTFIQQNRTEQKALLRCAPVLLLDADCRSISLAL